MREPPEKKSKQNYTLPLLVVSSAFGTAVCSRACADDKHILSVVGIQSPP